MTISGRQILPESGALFEASRPRHWLAPRWWPVRLFELRSKKHHDWWHWDESGTADFLGLMITNMFLLVVLCLPNRENHTHLFKPHILTHDWMKIQFGYTFEEILDEFLSNSACHHWLYVKIGYPHIWCLESFTFLMPWQFLTATPNFQTHTHIPYCWLHIYI